MLFIYFEDQFSMRFEVDYNLLPFSGLHFVLLIVSFALKKFFNFRTFHFTVILLTVCATVIFRKLYPLSICSRLPPSFFSINFSITSFMLKSLIYLNLSFIWGEKELFPFFFMSLPTYASTIC